MDEHVIGDFSCPYCDRLPEECLNCGGIVHFTLVETYEKVLPGMPLELEESFCDICFEDYQI